MIGATKLIGTLFNHDGCDSSEEKQAKNEASQHRMQSAVKSKECNVTDNFDEPFQECI